MALCGIGRDEMRWQGYLTALLLFNALGLIFLTAILMLQADLPLNPRHFRDVMGSGAEHGGQFCH